MVPMAPTAAKVCCSLVKTIDVLLDGEDAIWGTLSDDQRGTVDPLVLDPFNYIDAGVVQALSELERQ